MKIKNLYSGTTLALDVAICVGLVAVFLAISVPLIRGALIRRQTAECAQKILWAADAFDTYANMRGEYPPDANTDGAPFPCVEMIGTFMEMDIDWWGDATDVGGAWSWFRNGGHTGYIAISQPKATESSMRRIDALVDDGNLDAGSFRRFGPVYCYVITKHRLSLALLQ